MSPIDEEELALEFSDENNEGVVETDDKVNDFSEAEKVLEEQSNNAFTEQNEVDMTTNLSEVESDQSN